MNMMESAFFIVNRRCAIIKVVRPFMSSFMAFVIRSSVLVSIELVASSRISILGCAIMVRARESSCFSPELRVETASLIWVS